jgi:hypothetical protein
MSRTFRFRKHKNRSYDGVKWKTSKPSKKFTRSVGYIYTKKEKKNWRRIFHKKNRLIVKVSIKKCKVIPRFRKTTGRLSY